jgi:hypothetical protein
MSTDKITFAVEMADLRNHINYVRNGLGTSKTDLGVLLIKFELNGTKATLFTAGKEMFCRTEMKVTRSEGAKDGSFSVMGAKMERLISQVQAEQVTMLADAEGLEVHAGYLTVNFELYDGAVLKTVENGVQEHLTMEGAVCPQVALEEGLACAKSCTTTTSVRPEVTHAELRDGRVLSSDGRKIMVYNHSGFPKAMTLKVPAGILTDVVGALKNMKAEAVQVISAAGYYYVKGDGNRYTLGIRKVERTFPAIEGRLQAQTTAADEVSIDKHVFENMLRGVALGLSAEDVRVGVEVGGTGQEAYVEISGTNQMGRRSFERASAGRKSTDRLNFPVSFRHLLDTLAVFKGDSVVDMMVQPSLNLLMVRDTTATREVLTLIPFRTDKVIEEEKKAQIEAEKAKTAADAAEQAVAPAVAAAALDSTADLDV